MANALILIDLLTKLAVRFAEGMAVLRKAQAEGRDVTDEELDEASRQYDEKRAEVLGQLDDPDDDA